MKSEPQYVLFANCIPVKGYSRSLLCDLYSNKIIYIPNDLCEILTTFSVLRIKNIKKHYDNIYDNIIDEYIEFLLEEKFIFKTQTPELFPKIKTTWKNPSIITNAILDRNAASNYEFPEIFKQLEVLGCNHLQIRFFDKINVDQISSINELLSNWKSSIISLDFIIPYCINIEEEKIKFLINQFPRITCITVHTAPYIKKVKISRKNFDFFIYTSQKLDSSKHCGNISSEYFIVNIKSFTESLNFNSCLNRKISVDCNGNIKNCPSMLNNFGNIKNTRLDQALENSDFRKYWNITKDQINECKICEFRHVCTDCRAYLEKPNNIYSKPLKCGYNPYNNQWSKWSINPLKTKAIDYYGIKKID